MKKTKQSWLFFILEIIFTFIVPCGFVWSQYGVLTTGYKISVTSILLLILIHIMFRKLFLNKWIKNIDAKISNIEANALSIVDEAAIRENKKAWRNCNIVQLIFSSIVPLLFFILAIITIKNVEKGLIELYGCLIFCLVSVCIGIFCRVLEIYSVKLSHEKDKDKT